MSAVQRREFEELRREVRRLRQELAQRPIGGSGGVNVSLYTITIVGGNTLDTGQAGVKYSSSLITEVPSAYNPNVITSFIDGIGRGSLRINGSLQSGSFLVVNDPNSPIQRALVANDVIAVYNTTSIPVTGDPNTTVTAYIPLFL